MTALYQRLRLVERFPQLKINDVAPGFDPAKETHMAVMMYYEHVREVQEARDRAVVI